LKSDPNNRVFVGKVGRPHGVSGLSRINLASDFPEFFAIGRELSAVLQSGEERLLSVRHFSGDQKILIGFDGVNDPEAASQLTNASLFTTIAETKKHIRLKEGERFSFDLIGKVVYEGELAVARIAEIGDGEPPLITLIATDSKRNSKSRVIVPFDEHFFIGFEGDKVLVKNIRDLFDAL
jgi:ribosomal 30S subunit maturation factor RimM